MIEANTLLGLDHTQSGVGGLRDYFISGEPLLAICNSRGGRFFYEKNIGGFCSELC